MLLLEMLNLNIFIDDDYDGTMNYLPSKATHQMPFLTKPYVELYCDRPMILLLTPLTLNLLLLMLCCIFAFLTRKLPHGFNELWYILLSVSTTLFIRMAFLPTYFLTFYAYHKEALLSLALLLNALACIMCLFAPKVNALFYLDDADIITSNLQQSKDGKLFTTNSESVIKNGI